MLNIHSNTFVICDLGDEFTVYKVIYKFAMPHKLLSVTLKAIVNADDPGHVQL